jgi:hypothetical protein
VGEEARLPEAEAEIMSNSPGHVRRRGNKWAFVLNLGRDAAGKRRQKWVSGFDSEDAAQKAMVKALATLYRGDDPSPSR